jgi:hypothetical protein
MATMLIQAAASAALNIGLGMLRAAITPTQKVTKEGQRLSGTSITFASESQTIPRLWGRKRINGNIFWATRFKETKSTTTETSGGKGGGQPKTKVTTIEYTYTASFAIGLCEASGGVSIGRVWVDGTLLDLTEITYRVYDGDAAQVADSLIETVEGAGNVPAYRGLAYVVFEDFPLKNFGNRLPQISIEVIKKAESLDTDSIENLLRGVNIIPGASEFVYGITPAFSDDGKGNSNSENVHNARGVSDFVVSLDQLEDVAPNWSSASLVVSWFGTDLRCNQTVIEPRVEQTTATINKTVYPNAWAVSGLTRSTANAVSVDADGRPVFGGTPSDLTIREAIDELHNRGARVQFYPFILMDIAYGNTLPDPYTGATGQPEFPWRGRMTCDPAPGVSGTPDKTSAAATQVNAFLGSAASGDFGTWNGSTIPYSGPVEWSYRRMILHYAKLVSDKLQSGDIFIIGSELVGLTQVRDSATSYPFVTGLVTLAADVSALMPAGVLVSYAADWSEYHSHRPDDGTGDVLFNMDTLWSSADIDFVGIDNYLPVADWRDGENHLDKLAGYKTTYNLDYLKSNIEGGEYYDWYYASAADRDSQIRTAIVDTDAAAEHWVFRQKDVRGWWNSAHHDRPGGVRSGSATAWVVESKPVYFTEFGCPAIDKGANQPNVFYDPKSSESTFPYYSSGARDELVQRRYMEAVLQYWRDNAPTSGVYSGRMIDPANCFVWTWDARPYPEFPYRTDIWADGANYDRGHWINGRLGMMQLSTVLTEIAAAVGFAVADLDFTGLDSAQTIVRGFAVEALASPREEIEILQNAFVFDAYQSGAILKFVSRNNIDSVTIQTDDLVTDESNPGGYKITRAQETELPNAVKVLFSDEGKDFQAGAVDAIRQTGSSQDIEQIDLMAVVMPESYARALPHISIEERWRARERAGFELPLSKLAIETSDALSISIKGRSMTFKVDGVQIGESRSLDAIGYERSIYDSLNFSAAESSLALVPYYGRPVVEYMDLPMFTGEELQPWSPRVAAYMSPWPGGVGVYQDDSAGGWLLNTTAVQAAMIGELAFDFYSGPEGRWDYGNELYVDVYSSEQVLAATELAVLNGSNAVAVKNSSGDWEIIQFVNVDLVSAGRYKLTQLLRGQLGTESAMADPVSAGARVVFLDPDELFALDVGQAAMFSDIEFRAGPGTVAVSDTRFVQEAVTIGAVGLRPYSPEHLRGSLNGNDWSLSWVRRTRFGGDNWQPETVPIFEDTESYDLEILNGSTVARTVTGLSSPAYVYTSAMQVSDFGSNQSSLTFRVYQNSVLYGRGTPRENTVT